MFSRQRSMTIEHQGKVDCRRFFTTRKISLHRLILLSMLVVLSGCLLDGSDGDSNGDEGDEQARLSVELLLNIVDEDSNPIVTATASSETFALMSQSYDSVDRLIVEAASTGDSGVVTIAAAGFESAILQYDGMQASAARTVRLLDRPSPITVDGTGGGEYSGPNGALVDLPANAFVTENGLPVTGSVELFVTTVDISSDDDLQAFPGGFQGLATADSEPGLLASLGVSSYSFEQGGEPLQLADGQTAQLTLPLYVDTYPNGDPIPLGDQIPIWRLNEMTGIWEEESTGTVVSLAASPTGLGLQGTTGHFSSFNADIWAGSSPGQIGPGGQSLTALQTCIVTVEVPEFLDGTRFNFGAAQRLGGLPSTRRISSIYFEPFSFPVFRGFEAAYNIVDLDFGDGIGRSATDSFTCNAETLNLVALFENIPVFSLTDVEARPTFTEVNGMQTVTSNRVAVSAIFINDADNFAQYTSNIGIDGQVFSGRTILREYFDTDPSPANFAFFIENENGTADRQSSVEYVSSAVPIIRGAFIDYIPESGNTTFFLEVEGADTLSILAFDEDTGLTTEVIESDVGYLDIYVTDQITETGTYTLVFTNQYGESSTNVFVPVNANCIPNSDLPCDVPQ